MRSSHVSRLFFGQSSIFTADLNVPLNIVICDFGNRSRRASSFLRQPRQGPATLRQDEAGQRSGLSPGSWGGRKRKWSAASPQLIRGPQDGRLISSWVTIFSPAFRAINRPSLQQPGGCITNKQFIAAINPQHLKAFVPGLIADAANARRKFSDQAPAITHRPLRRPAHSRSSS
jgi:hypothetical protein